MKCSFLQLAHGKHDDNNNDDDKKSHGDMFNMFNFEDAWPRCPIFYFILINTIIGEFHMLLGHLPKIL